MSSDQSPLTVAAGATLQNGGDALTVAIPATSSYDPRSVNITVAGSVVSTGGNGIAFTAGPSDGVDYDFYGTSGTVTVAVGGSVVGLTAISLVPTPGILSSYAPASLSVDNFGTITGTGGTALASSGSTSFSTITNETGGTIGAIAAKFSSLTNNGTIDGGQASALNNVPFYSEQSIMNLGTIRSEGSAATVLLATSFGFTNSGTITNTGGGVAVSSSGAVSNAAAGVISANGSDVLTGTYLAVSNYGTIINTGAGDALSGFGLTITNYAGGTITAGSGGIAVNSSGSLQLTNSGTINGNVLAGSSGGYYSVLVDTSQGTINGNVTFGGTFNTLVGIISGGSVQTGVNGTITGATGTGVTNTLELATAQSTTLTSTVTLPTNFNQLQFAPAAGTTLTLGDGFNSPGTIVYTGQGALVNATTLSGNGQIVNGSGIAGTFTNTGTITSNNLGGLVALAFSSYASLNNSGTITATGDAVNGGYNFTNSGTISAGGTAVQDFADGGFNNSGIISSSAGTALSLSQSCTCSVASNSGTISGAQIGLQLSDGVMNNAGTITALGYGVTLSSYATVNNLSGGVINGGTVAIGDPNGAPFGVAVTNLGMINGDVDLASNGQYYSGNRYDAAPGSVLNGNLTLGSSDTLITDLVNNGSGQFAGISGTVTASNSNLIYNVSASATIPATPSGFSSVAYQLFNNPTLTMTAGTSSNTTLVLAGTGTVDLNGTISATNAYAVDTQGGLLTAAGYNTTGTTLLTINNTGTIATTLTTANTGIGAALALGSNSVVNNGSITFSDVSGQTVSGEAAVTGGSAITNAGTITGTRVSAIALGSAYGASSTLTNSGVISSDQTAIVLNSSGTITNSGTITSSSSAAIATSPYDYYSSATFIANQAGGTIAGAGDAVDMLGGLVSNAGTINGNVNLAYGATPYATTGGYFDNGGTLNGNLTLTAGESLVVPLGSGGNVLGGVTGTITANGAALVYKVTANTTTVPTISSGFGSVGYQLSNNAALTIAGGSNLATTLDLAGSGAVVLDGAIATTDQPAVLSQPALTATGLPSDPNTLSITNNGTISLTTANSNYVSAVQLGSSDTLVNNGTISVTQSANPEALAAVNGGQSVTNNGTITSDAAYGILVDVSSASGPVTITNSGTIATSNFAVGADTDLGDINITNSGRITGALAANYLYIGSASLQPPLITITNSGTITGEPIYGQEQLAVYVTQGTIFNSPAQIPTALVNLTNSGAITGDIVLDNVNYSLVDMASGDITGNIYTDTYPGVSSGSIALAGGFAGNIYGGAGLASLAVSGGSASTPVAFGNLANISTYTQTGGYATLSGVADLGAATINGGTLVSLIGSTINTPLLTIGARGTFASGGTINGNLSNNGNLHVGASPDTLTVNGNVTLAWGSTSTFEVTPTASSKLVTSGTVTIAANTTLQIIPLQPIMPGTSINLIDATGGISGSFSALSGISGQLEEKGGNLSLLALFDTPQAQNSQLARGIGYVNALIASGNAPSALDAAIPGLTAANGEPNTAAFARLTAEPYASATQIGVENALTLSRAAREIDWSSGLHSGDIFTFGQALGGWRGLNGDAARGTSTANISGYGFLGGLGLSHGPLSVAAFGGYLDQTQTTAALGASTQAKGFVGGVTGRLDSGPARLAISVLYDDAHADTQRDLLDGSQLSAGYDLHSWSLDGEASTRLALGADWVARPHIGSTWVWTQRGAANEVISSIFALTVAAEHHTAGYIDGGMRFESPDEATSRFTRYLDLGIRYELQGRGTEALAGFAGGPITLLADGVRRGAASALVSAGGNYRITSAVSLFLSGSGEMTRTGSSADVTGGVRMKF